MHRPTKTFLDVRMPLKFLVGHHFGCPESGRPDAAGSIS